MRRFAAISLLCAAACAHDHAFDRREVGAMKNASPAVSPWPGPVSDPIAAGERHPSACCRTLRASHPQVDDHT